MPPNVTIFPRRPLGPESVRLVRDEPCIVVILPVVCKEHDMTPAQRLGRFLNAILDEDRPG